jgi:hypothetical protein
VSQGSTLGQSLEFMARDKWPLRLPSPPLRGTGTTAVADLLAWSSEVRTANLEVARARAVKAGIDAQQEIAAQYLEESIRRKDAAYKAYTLLYGMLPPGQRPSQPGSDISGLSERALGKRKADAMEEVGNDDGADDDSVARALGELEESGLASMSFT